MTPTHTRSISLCSLVVMVDNLSLLFLLHCGGEDKHSGSGETRWWVQSLYYLFRWKSVVNKRKKKIKKWKITQMPLCMKKLCNNIISLILLEWLNIQMYIFIYLNKIKNVE
jgi:sterol desaturase/sphingolipid hydroxylase (fatty acid hydroxylase superfamily)